MKQRFCSLNTSPLFYCSIFKNHLKKKIAVFYICLGHRYISYATREISVKVKKWFGVLWKPHLYLFAYSHTVSTRHPISFQYFVDLSFGLILGFITFNLLWRPCLHLKRKQLESETSGMRSWKIVNLSMFFNILVCFGRSKFVLLVLNHYHHISLQKIRHGSHIWQQLSAASPINRPQPKVIITIVIIKLKLWPAARLCGQSCSRIKLPPLSPFHLVLARAACIW